MPARRPARPVAPGLRGGGRGLTRRAGRLRGFELLDPLSDRAQPFLVLLANRLELAPEALDLRLEVAGVLRRGRAERIENQRAARERAAERLRDRPAADHAEEGAGGEPARRRSAAVSASRRPVSPLDRSA